MRPVFFIIDMQKDFLLAPSLYPATGEVIDRAVILLNQCRDLAIPVVHILTCVNRANDQRMLHWKQNDKWICVEGSSGFATPDKLKPLENEVILYKQAFSAFTNDKADKILNSFNCNILIVAGVHLHACIRTTVLDACQRGIEVWVAEDAVTSDEPLHAAITRRYLKNRAVSFYNVDTIISLVRNNNKNSNKITHTAIKYPDVIYNHKSPVNNNLTLWKEVITNEKDIFDHAEKAKSAWYAWNNTDKNTRIKIIIRWVKLIEQKKDQFINQTVIDIGKPVSAVREELKMGLNLLKAISFLLDGKNTQKKKGNFKINNRPLGVVAIITPYNNPLAVPLGKIGPALFYGNAIIWKPALAASAISKELLKLLFAAGCPNDLVAIETGDDATAESIMLNKWINAVSITGSLKAGYAAQEICAGRIIKLQAELGGNNASIVWSDSDLKDAASKVAESAFAFAGQRCTANSRVIIEKSSYDIFLNYLQSATAALIWGDPQDERTQVGPINSVINRDRVKATVERAILNGNTVFIPHKNQADYETLVKTGCYYPPTIICCDDPFDEIVQEETFGPVLVVQKTGNWDHAVYLCNNVRQGLVSSLFSQSAQLHKNFINKAQSGILKINEATSGVEPDAPFGGWKASGIGPPEHGLCDREFYTRTQTIYL